MTFEQRDPSDEALDQLLAEGDAAALERLRAGIDVDVGRAGIMCTDLPARHHTDGPSFPRDAAGKDALSPDEHEPGLDDDQCHVVQQFSHEVVIINLMGEGSATAHTLPPKNDRLKRVIDQIHLLLNTTTEQISGSSGLEQRWRRIATSVGGALDGLLGGLDSKSMGRAQALDIIQSCKKSLERFPGPDESSIRDRVYDLIDDCLDRLDDTTDLVNRLFDAAEDGACAPARR